MSAPDPCPFISVVICTRNRPEDIALCLPTVLSGDYTNFEVILVDQSTDAATKNQVAELTDAQKRLRYIPTQTVGKTNALDIGIAEAKGEILAFTDDDCEVPPAWLHLIAQEFEADDKADILFGPVLPSPALADLPDICVPSWQFSDARYMRHGEVCGMGANMALRRGVLAKLSGPKLFDALLGPGTQFPAGEEGDFVYRLRRAGATAALRPSLRLYHRAYRQKDQWEKIVQGYGIGDGAFYTKHARCGDIQAVRILFGRLTSSVFRSLAKKLIRRPDAVHAPYASGLWQGIRASRRMHVDCRTRLYVVPDGPAPERIVAVPGQKPV